jgi:hypothetical protein
MTIIIKFMDKILSKCCHSTAVALRQYFCRTTAVLPPHYHRAGAALPQDRRGTAAKLLLHCCRTAVYFKLMSAEITCKKVLVTLYLSTGF